MEGGSISQLARVLTACVASGLVMGARGFVTMSQAQEEDTLSRSATSPDAVFARVGDTRSENDLDSFLQRLAQQSRQIKQLQVENRRQSEGLKRLGEVPATGVAYRALGEAGQGDLEAKVGTLWGEMPIWLPYIEASFRGGSVINRGEVDLFMPLIWSDTSPLFVRPYSRRGFIGASSCTTKGHTLPIIPLQV